MRTNRLFIICLAVSALVAGGARAALVTTDVYDPTGDGSNNIDTEAATNDITLTDFRTLVNSAYDNDLGGVVNFDELNDPELNGFVAAYGTGGTEMLSVSPGSNNAYGSGSTTGWNVRDSSGSNGAISDPKVLRGGWIWDFDFDTGLTAVAITFVERNNSNPNVVATIELQDGTRTEKFNATASDDTFFAYTASAGNPIVSLELDTSNGDSPGEYHEVDELGFVVVPEPATLALLGVGGAAVLVRRRRRD